MYTRHKTGKEGEVFAEKYLEKLGYEIIEKNFRCRQGEIDIIAIDKEEFVFIEVKTRTNRTIWASKRSCKSNKAETYVEVYRILYIFKTS